MSTDNGLPRLYTAEEVAAVIPNRSAWWIRKQARLRRFPCIRTGGNNHVAFTEEHVREIVQSMEQRPFDEVPHTTPARTGKKTTRSTGSTSVPELRARKPRRARRGGGPGAA